MSDQAQLLEDEGKLDEAELLYSRALEGFEQQLGALHPDTLDAVSSLAGLLMAQGELADAEPLFRRARREAKGSARAVRVGCALS